MAAAALLVACGPKAAPGPQLVRLLEQKLEGAPAIPAAAVAGIGDATLFGASSGLRTGSRPAPDGYDLRNGYFGAAGSSFRFRVDLSPGAVLRTAVAAWPPEGTSSTVTLRVVGRAGAGEPHVLRELAVAAGPEERWQTLEIPLERLGAGPVELELASDGDAGTSIGWDAPEISARLPAPRRPSLVLISLDTLRADRLGSYGYGLRSTSPALDRFARRSIRFAHAYSQAPWTRPSHRTLFTSRYPAFVEGGETFLASRLWAQNYRTLALAGGGQMSDRMGMGSGFENYAVTSWIETPSMVLDRLAERPLRDFFLFLHTYEIHDPYTDRRFAKDLPSGKLGPTFKRFDKAKIEKGRRTAVEETYIQALYDGDIAHTDEQLAKLFELFERRGIFESAVVIVTSDHGEEFWEHGRWRHGQSLYDELLHVPLFVSLPSGLRRRFAPAFPASASTPAVVEDQVGLIDLVPTIFELLELPRPGDLQGRSLLPLLRGESLSERPLAGQSLYYTPRQRVSLRTERFKLIIPVEKWAKQIRPELYDLRRDPGERQNIAPRYSEAVRTLTGQLNRILAGGQELETGAEPIEDQRLKKELEALGYIGN